MFFSRSNIVHTEVIELQATPEQVREFIMTPERILDYYPDPLEGGIIEPGVSFYCCGKAGVSLLEIIPSESNEKLIVLKVTTATNMRPPYTEERIKSAKFFTMIEHWQLKETTMGTSLTKSWRNIHKYKMKFLPMGFIVRKSARAETRKLKAAWEKLAKAKSGETTE
ncbi:MAG: hypothetical protein V7709_04005 [Halioglobus sp.]